ncbi:MAG TPA: hypothetical protein VGR69_04630 [Candidatus Rubrimentiphilum sp.]|nr:hypothetical protein [Candidatus Rubrimentiphilum sp.]
MTIAVLALGPITARAANTPTPTDPYSAVDQMRAAFSHLESVQLVEKFPNGAVATVQLMPNQGTRVSQTSVSKDRLLLDYATQPGGDVTADIHDFTITPLGRKSLYGNSVDGYRLIDQTGAVETLWINTHHLPVALQINAYGESVDVLYGDYNNPAIFAAKP